MAVKGAASKQQVTEQILNTFGGSFVYDKEIRIPCMEDGQEVQIKVTLTAAQKNVERGGDTAIPTATKSAATGAVAPSDEDKAAIEKLVARLF